MGAYIHYGGNWAAGLDFDVFCRNGIVFALLCNGDCAIKDYTTAEILSALESLRLPKSIIIASTITLRYIPTFRTEFSYIKESMRLRGFSFSFLHPIRSFRFFVVPQLFRCMALSEEVTAAGMVKGIDNPNRRSSYYEQKLKFCDLACIILIFAAVIGAALW